MVYQASYAAFTGQTRNSGNQWSTGSINLTDDDNGTSRFQVSNMLPGATDTKCIKVTANASVASTVKGYAVNPVTCPQRLENRIKVTIEDGAGGSFADCNGFVARWRGARHRGAPVDHRHGQHLRDRLRRLGRRSGRQLQDLPDDATTFDTTA